MKPDMTRTIAMAVFLAMMLVPPAFLMLLALQP